MTVTPWSGFAVRPNTTDPEGQVPIAGGLSVSPDIIPQTGSDPAPTTTFATTQSWAQTYPAQVSEGVPNYLYVRAKYFAHGQPAGPATVDVRLYAVGNLLINLPSEWLDSPLTLQDGKTTVQKVTASQDQQIVVAPEPWFWNAPPPPSGSDHYCVFAVLDGPNEKNQLLNGDVPQTYSDMASLVTNELYVGWKNVAEVPTNAIWTKTMRMVMPPKVTDDSTLHVYFYGTAGYVNGLVAVSVGDGASFNPPIAIGTPTSPMKIVTAGDTYGMLTKPVAGEKSTYISVSYLGGANPGFGDRISVVCGWVPKDADVARSYQERDAGQALPDAIAADALAQHSHDVGWEVPIGAMHYDANPSQNQ